MYASPVSEPLSLLKNAALQLASLGFHVFPCKPGSKEPATRHGHYEATTDFFTIERWWTENPHYNIGMAPDPSGLAVIDADGEVGKRRLFDLQAEHGFFPDTYTVRTPRDGQHLHFKGSLPSTVQKLAQKVDTRGFGGYVLMPPSVVEGKHYVEENDCDPVPLPPWVTRLCQRTIEKITVSEDIELDTPTAVFRATTHLLRMRPVSQGDGADAATYKTACLLRDMGISEQKCFDLLTTVYKIEPQDERFEAFITRKVTNAYKYGQNDVGANAVAPTSEIFKNAKLDRVTRQAENDDSPASALISRLASDIQIERIEWLWRDRFPRGKCSLLAGDGGLGKTTALLDMAAHVSRGAPWPDGRGDAPIASVIIFSGEDDPADTLVPRLMAAGADLARIRFIEAVKDQEADGTRTFNLQADLAKLEQQIIADRDVALVIFDPISSYFGKTDTYRNTEVRGVLEPMVRMAARLGVAVIGNTHLAKGSKGRANMRVLDSVAMTAAVRSVYQVVEDADGPDRRLFLPSKANVGQRVDGLSFTISSKIVEAERQITGSFVVWGERVNTTADEALLAMDEKMRKPSAVDDAVEFLKAYLAAGPKTSPEVFDAALANGHADRTVRRAIRKLGVRSSKMDMDAGWIMTLQQLP